MGSSIHVPNFQQCLLGSGSKALGNRIYGCFSPLPKRSRWIKRNVLARSEKQKSDSNWQFDSLFATPPASRDRAQRRRKEAWSYAEVKERIAYSYFCWRQDTWSDLQIFLAVNFFVLLFFGWVKGTVVDVLDHLASGDRPFWHSIYEVLVVVFGQELPDEGASVAQQVFGVSVAIAGVVGFGSVLALIEQLMLQVLEDNVKRGSRVFENGHVLLLGWCESQRDLEVVQKFLSQACFAYAAEGGRVLVVMTLRDKLEMESLFRRVLPMDERLGSQLVFRSGSPLVPNDLRMVSAPSAASIVIVSDTSRSPIEADSEAIRAAILLDELDCKANTPRSSRIVVELKTTNALGVLQYSCSGRTIGLHTGELNARRLSRMVKHPIVAAVSYIVYNYASRPQVYLQRVPQLVGKQYSSVQAYLPKSTVYGVVIHASRRCQLNPPGDLVIQPYDELVLLHPVPELFDEMAILPQPVHIDMGAPSLPERGEGGDIKGFDEEGWDPSRFRSGSFSDDEDAAYHGNGANGPMAAPAAGPGSGSGDASSLMYVAPLQDQWLNANEAENVIICGFREEAFMSDLLREMDHGPTALPPGSTITLFNSTATPEMLDRVQQRNRLRNLSITHVPGNPLDYDEITGRVDVTSFTTAIVLCDYSWIDPDRNDQNGLEVREQRDMLRLESQILLVQLHLRKCLADAGFPEINIICEKVAAEGQTRFEDRYRLPMGISVNMPSFAAKLLACSVYNPRMILAYQQMGGENELEVRSAAAFSRSDEMLSYWQLQARVRSVGSVLFGFYHVPDNSTGPIDFVINMEGLEERSRVRRWNDGRTQLIILAPKVRVVSTSNGASEVLQTLDSAEFQRGALVAWETLDSGDVY